MGGRHRRHVQRAHLLPPRAAERRPAHRRRPHRPVRCGDHRHRRHRPTSLPDGHRLASRAEPGRPGQRRRHRQHHGQELQRHGHRLARLGGSRRSARGAGGSRRQRHRRLGPGLRDRRGDRLAATHHQGQPVGQWGGGGPAPRPAGRLAQPAGRGARARHPGFADRRWQPDRQHRPKRAGPAPGGAGREPGPWSAGGGGGGARGADRGAAGRGGAGRLPRRHAECQVVRGAGRLRRHPRRGWALGCRRPPGVLRGASCGSGSRRRTADQRHGRGGIRRPAPGGGRLRGGPGLADPRAAVALGSHRPGHAGRPAAHGHGGERAPAHAGRGRSPTGWSPGAERPAGRARQRHRPAAGRRRHGRAGALRSGEPERPRGPRAAERAAGPERRSAHATGRRRQRFRTRRARTCRRRGCRCPRCGSGNGGFRQHGARRPPPVPRQRHPGRNHRQPELRGRAPARDRALERGAGAHRLGHLRPGGGNRPLRTRHGGAAGGTRGRRRTGHGSARLSSRHHLEPRRIDPGR